jgi:hypothetical protein
MVAANSNGRIPPGGFNTVPSPNRLPQRVRPSFDPYPEPAREKLLPKAVRREIAFRNQRETENGGGLVRPPLSTEDLRLHARLTERLAVLHYQRYGLWPRLRRFFFGSRLVR